MSLTHDEDIEDPIEGTSPRCDRIFVVIRMEGSRDPFSSTVFDEVSLNLSYNPVIKFLVSGPLRVHMVKLTVSTMCTAISYIRLGHGNEQLQTITLCLPSRVSAVRTRCHMCRVA
jgi:hypothetical protein